MVVRIPHVLVMWLPLILFAGEVVLVLTVGPRLIASARKRRNLPPLPTASRVGRCLVASILAILTWLVILFLSMFILTSITFSHGIQETHTQQELNVVDTIVSIASLCFFLAFLSALPLCLASSITLGPCDKSIPFLKRYINAPGLLILACIWVFWAVFLPWVHSARSSISRVANMSRIKGVEVGLMLYANDHQAFPARLGQLVDNGYCSPHDFGVYGSYRIVDPAKEVDGQPYLVPKEFHYIRLPETAPRNLVWIWIDPTIFKGKPIPVVYKDGHVDLVPPEVLCTELFDTYQWFLAPDNNKPTFQGREWNNPNRDFFLLRIPTILLSESFPLTIFFIAVVVVLTTGPILIGISCKDQHVPPPTVFQRVGMCFRASLVGIIVWWILFLFVCNPLYAIFITVCKPTPHSFLPLILKIIGFGLLAFVTLQETAKCCIPKQLSAITNQKRLYGPAILIVLSTFSCTIPCMLLHRWAYHSTYLLTGQISLRNINYTIKEYSEKHGHNPQQLSNLIPKDQNEDEDEDETHLYLNFRNTMLEDEDLEKNPELLNRNVHYLHLPTNAPGELLWIWPEPALYHGEKSPVLLKNGEVEFLWPGEIAERIGRTYEWLMEHRGISQTMPASAPAK